MKGVITMEKITKERLLNAGWYEDRKITISNMMQEYQKIGLEMPINVELFLKEFGMLKIDPTNKKYYDVDFNPLNIIGDYFDGDYFKECLIEYGINKVSYPIGTARKDNLMILLTEENEFYCFTDGCLIKVGDCIEDMLDCLVGECREAEILVN